MYKIEEHKGGYVVKVKSWNGWRRLTYRDYGATGRRPKVFKTRIKAQWAYNQYAKARGL